jgi:Acetoacetate decarboxylase (ADC)
MTDTYTIDGRTITMPVEVRRARNWVATYLVKADALRPLVAPTGLEVAQARPGKGILTLGFVEYSDTDLGEYHEFMVSALVRQHGRPPATAREMGREVRRNDVGVYIHRLPVDDGFSMDAGRGIWGYPKTMMEFSSEPSGASRRWTLRDDGKLVLSMRWNPRWFPLPRSAAPPTYTLLDGVLRRTAWESRSRGVRARPGGVALELGDHPIAAELRSLGLPKRALLAISMREMRARFSSAEVIERTGASGSSENESRASS